MIGFIYRLPLGTLGLIILAAAFLWAIFKDKFEQKSKSSVWYTFNIVLILFSLSAIAFVTFIDRAEGIRAVYLIPLRSFELAKSNPEMYRTMWMNVFLFVPLGLAVSNTLIKKVQIWKSIVITVIVGVIVSAGVEIFQYVFALGQSEADDIICNTFGAFLGSVSLIINAFINWIRRKDFYDRRIAKYLTITFSVTWTCWCLLSVIASPEYYFSFDRYVYAPLHIIGGFAPFLAALTTSEKKLSFAELLKILTKHKKGTMRYFLIIAVLEIAVFGLSSCELNSSLPLYLIPSVFVQAVLIYGGNEEIGWRGTMQPFIETKFSFPVATIITGTVWSFWHIPLWFVDGSSQQNIPFILYLFLGVILSFWFSAVYKKTESVLFCSILHGLTNTLLSVFVIYLNWILVIGLAAVTIISILIWNKESNKIKQRGM